MVLLTIMKNTMSLLEIMFTKKAQIQATQMLYSIWKSLNFYNKIKTFKIKMGKRNIIVIHLFLSLAAEILLSNCGSDYQFIHLLINYFLKYRILMSRDLGFWGFGVLGFWGVKSGLSIVTP